VAAPVLAAVGALAALLTHCTIEVERVAPADSDAPPVQRSDDAPKSGAA
jgi:hypothetical protein